MDASGMKRRDFLKTTATAAVTGAVTGSALAADAGTKAKILNFHSRMKYRRLGKTNLMLSELSLGGHWKNRGGGRYWDTFSNDDVPRDVVKNRTEVMSACIDAGVNYLDITTAAECLAYGAALKGRREKMYVGADDHRLGPRNRANCNVKKLTHNVDECLRRLKTDYLDIWRVQADMGGGNTDAEVEVMIETFERLKKQGKARYFGISSHKRDWLKHIVEKYPQIEMVIHPCTASTKKAGEPITRQNVQEVAAGAGGNDRTASIFDAVKKQNVGLVTIKPFGGGHVFKGAAKFPVMGAGLKNDNDFARMTLQCILTNDAITATVPGMTTVYEVENNARASYSRLVADLTPEERRWVQETTGERLATLPPDYQWLREWDVI